MITRKKPIIIFGAPQIFGLSGEIVKYLTNIGFEVIDVSFAQDFSYKNKYQKIKNFFKKSLLGDKSYKKKLRFEKYRADFENKIASVLHADYALFADPHVYPEEFLRIVKNKSKQFIAYEWDSMQFFKDAIQYIPLFDRYYSFDADDVKKYPGLLPCTNCYFDYYKKSISTSGNNIIYFLGTYTKSRVRPLNAFAEKIKPLDFKINIFLLSGKNTGFKNNSENSVRIISRPFSFEENLKHTQEADVLLDLLSRNHTGLSFRVFEALGFGKKLITNNELIRNYDFYNPANIYILKDENWDGIIEFLNTPYQPPPIPIKEKYGFSNWIKYLLDIEPHQKISLPNI